MYKATMNRYVLSLLLATAFIPGANADTAKLKASQRPEEKTVWEKLQPAWDRMDAKLVDFVGETKQKLLADLAYGMAVSRQCDELDLNQEKFKADFDSLDDDEYHKLSKEEQNEYGRKIMGFYGAYIGLLTAEGLLDNRVFCDYAITQHAKGEGPYWTLKAN
jgi:hypothetical protein